MWNMWNTINDRRVQLSQITQDMGNLEIDIQEQLQQDEEESQRDQKESK